MKKYCPECGVANEYTMQEPKNCIKCKKSMSFDFSPSIKSEAKSQIVPQRTIKRKSFLQNENEEEEYSDESELQEYNLNNKSISLDLGRAASSFSLSELMSQKPTGDKRERGLANKSSLDEIQKIMQTNQVDLS